MSKQKGYPLIDGFRIFASILVITIHTAPLEAVSPALDFYLTRGLGRIAVPFFFITTAYFYFISPSKQRLMKIIKQLLLIYLGAIIIYLPLNFYNHYFSQNYLFFQIIKDLIFDGTFYHLWFLPAMILGLLFIAYLDKYISLKMSAFIVIILYLIGLGGDSYYGILSPGLKAFYEVIFWFSDYTRNGIFFAPLFIWIGKLLAVRQFSFSLKQIISGTAGSVILMFGEITLLKYLAYVSYDNGIFAMPRHDSMNIFLPFVMFWLYQGLLRVTGKRLLGCKEVSLTIYIFHPLMIVVIRLLGKLLHLPVLLNAPFMQFLGVLTITVLFSYLLLKGKKIYGKYSNES